MNCLLYCERKKPFILYRSLGSSKKTGLKQGYYITSTIKDETDKVCMLNGTICVKCKIDKIEERPYHFKPNSWYNIVRLGLDDVYNNLPRVPYTFYISNVKPIAHLSIEDNLYKKLNAVDQDGKKTFVYHKLISAPRSMYYAWLYGKDNDKPEKYLVMSVNSFVMLNILNGQQTIIKTNIIKDLKGLIK